MAMEPALGIVSAKNGKKGENLMFEQNWFGTKKSRKISVP